MGLYTNEEYMPISKVALKKQLTTLGINIIEGNYIRKKDAKKILGEENKTLGSALEFLYSYKNIDLKARIRQKTWPSGLYLGFKKGHLILFVEENGKFNFEPTRLLLADLMERYFLGWSTELISQDELE